MQNQAVPARVTRQLTRRSIFEALLHKGPISRADLAKFTGLSKQTTSEVVDAFEQQGLVRPVGRTSGNIGRTAVLYELSPEGGHVLGIDLGAKLRVAVADISSKVLAEATEPTDQRGGILALDQIAKVATRLCREINTHPSRIRSVVIGTPGVVNATTGAIDFAPNISGLGKLDVIGLLGEKLGTQVSVENDVNLGLLGEIWHGCAQNVSNVALIALGTGIGLGLCLNGQLIRGENGAAGEIGYFPIGGDPLRPEAKRQGCLEYEVGAAGIIRRYERLSGERLDSVQAVFDRMDDGDGCAKQIIDETARLIAVATAIVVSTADPKLVVLGGSIGARPGFARKVGEEFARVSQRQPEIRASALGGRAGVVGALAVALRRLHEDLFGISDLPAELALPAPRALAANAT